MKKLKVAVVALFALVTVGNVNAQDSDNPWAFSLGVNAIDFKNGSLVEDFLGNTDWNISNSISRFTVEKYLGNGITLQGAFSLSQLKHFNAENDIDGKYYAFDINGKYDLNELFGDTSWFDPYVFVGASYSFIDFQAEDFSEVMLNVGYGFNFWVGDNVGINYQATYKNQLADSVPNHFQHALGVVFRFGGNNDAE
ncbi:MAG: hypothetical protein JKY02_10695 [Flavobacteriaceae bacterium]|nr:hypothetical protein [Flavobacteriaceae bacterium]